MASAEDALNELLGKVRQQLFARGLVTPGTLLLACKRADDNGNGKLDKREFDEVLRLVGVFLSSQEIGLLFKRFDLSGDGAISYDEFLTVVKVREWENVASSCVLNHACRRLHRATCLKLGLRL